MRSWTPRDIAVVLGAAIIAFGIAMAGWLSVPRYTSEVRGSAIIRTDHKSGTVVICNASSCRTFPYKVEP